MKVQQIVFTVNHADEFSTEWRNVILAEGSIVYSEASALEYPMPSFQNKSILSIPHANSKTWSSFKTGQLELNRGQGFRKGAWIGALIGGLTGIAAGAALFIVDEPRVEEIAPAAMLVGGIVGTIGGVLIGGGIGAAMASN